MTNPSPDEKTRLGSSASGAERGTPPQIPDHRLLRCIGRGSCGEVWLARSILGTYRAVKIVYRHSFENERPYEREFTGMQRFEPLSRSHEGLIDILQIGRNDQAGYFYYVMELADDAGARSGEGPAWTSSEIRASETGSPNLKSDDAGRGA